MNAQPDASGALTFASSIFDCEIAGEAMTLLDLTTAIQLMTDIRQELAQIATDIGAGEAIVKDLSAQLAAARSKGPQVVPIGRQALLDERVAVQERIDELRQNEVVTKRGVTDVARVVASFLDQIFAPVITSRIWPARCAVESIAQDFATATAVHEATGSKAAEDLALRLRPIVAECVRQGMLPHAPIAVPADVIAALSKGRRAIDLIERKILTEVSAPWPAGAVAAGVGKKKKSRS